ncbi:MAG: hypothetical protein IIV91_01895 [Alistipes sp.]|nr:hypothetical protein [Alistipes sp.]
MKSIGKRVTIGFLSIVALLFVSGMISLFELGNMSNDTETILSASRRNMEIAKDMLNSANEHGSAVVHLAIFGEKGYADVCRRSISDLEGKFAAARSMAVDVSRLDSLALSIEQLQRVVDEYMAVPIVRNPEVDSLAVERVAVVADPVAGTEVEDLSVNAAAQSGKAWYDTTYKTAYNNLIERIQSFMTHTHSSLAPRAEQLNKNAYRSVAPVFISLIVMIAIVLMFYYFVGVYCIRPIKKINRALADYLSFRLPFNVKGELIDEFKELYDNIDALIGLSRQPQDNINKK